MDRAGSDINDVFTSKKIRVVLELFVVRLTAAARAAAATADAVSTVQAWLEQFGDKRLDQVDRGPEHLIHAGRRLLVIHADGRSPRAHGEVNKPGRGRGGQRRELALLLWQVGGRVVYASVVLHAHRRAHVVELSEQRPLGGRLLRGRGPGVGQRSKRRFDALVHDGHLDHDVGRMIVAGHDRVVDAFERGAYALGVPGAVQVGEVGCLVDRSSTSFKTHSLVISFLCAFIF